MKQKCITAGMTVCTVYSTGAALYYVSIRCFVKPTRETGNKVRPLE